MIAFFIKWKTLIIKFIWYNDKYKRDFVKLTTICSQNSAEQAGSITFTRDGDSFIFSDINVLDSSDKDKALYSGKKRISLDYESLLYSI